MTFFDSVRASFGPLKQSQVDGFNAILTRTTAFRIGPRAYILATAWHETAATMQPIYERGTRKYFDMYEPPSAKAKRLGNTMKGDGYKFRGRGYVQITGRANYAKMSNLVDVDLLANPDAALEPENAAEILIFGMVKGQFTGKRMSDYPDYKNMRRVVNGMDKADLIAGYAEKFEKALASQALAEPVQPIPRHPLPQAPKPVELPYTITADPPKPSFWAKWFRWAA